MKSPNIARVGAKKTDEGPTGKVDDVSDRAGYVVVDVWRAKPGKRDDVDTVLRDCAERFRKADGVVSVDYTRLEGQPDMYLVVFRYTDREARERFTASDELISTMGVLRQLWDLESPIYRGEDTGF